MPNTSLTEALKEAFTLCPSSLVYLATLEINHPDAVAPIYIVQDRKDWDLTLEGTGGVKTFEACTFRFSLPASGDNGIQELTIAIDNVDRRISDFINAVKESPEPVSVIYRPYLSTDPTTPQMNPPLVLNLRDIQITAVQITGRASFADIINKPFPHPSEIYTRERFPSLGNL